MIMKKESTLRIEIQRLRRIIDNDKHYSEEARMQAYDAEQALRWVLFKRCDWTPASLITGRLSVRF